MKIIISGSHGFIGNHLVARLKNKGIKVIRIPRLFLYRRITLHQFLKKNKADFIIHLAAYGNHYFQTNEYKTISANIQALVNLLDGIKNISIKGFLNFSTTHHNLESGSFYGSTKAAGEYIVRSYVQEYNIPAVNIRPYSIYGAREWDFRFIPTISGRIKKHLPITISDVDHDWTYVEDFIDKIFIILNKISKYRGKSVGIGTGKRRSNVFIAKKLMNIVGIKVSINIGLKRSYEIPAYRKTLLEQSNKKKNEEFLIASTTPLEVGLKAVYESKQRLKNKNY